MIYALLKNSVRQNQQHNVVWKCKCNFIIEIFTSTGKNITYQSAHHTWNLADDV